MEAVSHQHVDNTEIQGLACNHQGSGYTQRREPGAEPGGMQHSGKTSRRQPDTKKELALR